MGAGVIEPAGGRGRALSGRSRKNMKMAKVNSNSAIQPTTPAHRVAFTADTENAFSPGS